MMSLFVVALLAAGCGKDVPEPASPLSLVPENALMAFVLNDPSGIVRNVDSYIETGAPILGAGMLENLICSQLGVASLDSFPARFGFDPSGQVVFFMENAMPQSIVVAAAAPDFSLFVSFMEEMGAVLTEEEPLNGEPVFSMDTGDTGFFITGSRGVVIMAASRSKLETIVPTLSPEPGIEVQPTSLHMKFNMALIGPMAAAQMPMARMMMMQGMAQDSTMPSFVPAIMDVYMDGIELFLSQTDVIEVSLAFGPENFVITKDIRFIPGSQLAEMSIPSGGRDMLELIPMGDAATVRFRMPEEMSFGITSAFLRAFSSDIPEEDLMFWASMASNAAVSMYSDGPMHMVAAYELSGGETLEQIASSYSDFLDGFMPLFAENETMAQSFSFTDNGIVQIDGTDFYYMTMSIMPEPPSAVSFNYWMTVYDGALLLEMAPEPLLLLDVVSGDYVPAVLSSTGDMSGEMSLAGYLRMIMAFSQNGMDLPEISSDVIIYWNGGAENGAYHGEIMMDGSDALATGFAFYSLIAATM